MATYNGQDPTLGRKLLQSPDQGFVSWPFNSAPYPGNFGAAPTLGDGGSKMATLVLTQTGRAGLAFIKPVLHDGQYVTFEW